MEITENNSITDIDGNTYNLVQIGKQLWTAENLNVSKYRNGDEIPEVQDKTEWAALTTGAWCYLDNNPDNGAIYGKLYNQHAINDPRGLAPEGFHIPTDKEWTELTDCLGGADSGAGEKMKQIGTDQWKSNNIKATNSSGFTAQPGSSRFWNGSFTEIGYQGNWWSSSEKDINSAFFRSIVGSNYYKVQSNSFDKAFGFSVRCIKD